MLGCPTLVRKALNFTHKLSFLSFFFFYQSTALISHAVDRRQMYSGGSTIGIEIAPISPVIFTGAQKVPNLASFSTSFKFERARV